MTESARAVVATLPRRHLPRPFVDWEAAKRFGGWLRTARTQRKISIADMAKALGVSQNYLSRIESQSDNPNTRRNISRRDDLLHKIALVLDKDVREVRELARTTAREFKPKEALAQIETLAAGLASTKGEYREIGRRVLDALHTKGGERKKDANSA